MRQLLGILSVAVVLLVLPGCGEDREGSVTVEGGTGTETTQTGTTGTGTTETGPTGGAEAPAE